MDKVPGYTSKKRAKKGRLINSLCDLYVKNAENGLVQSTITRKIECFTEESATPVQGTVDLKNLDGPSLAIRKKTTVKSVALKVSILSSSMSII